MKNRGEEVASQDATVQGAAAGSVVRETVSSPAYASKVQTGKGHVSA